MKAGLCSGWGRWWWWLLRSLVRVRMRVRVRVRVRVCVRVCLSLLLLEGASMLSSLEGIKSRDALGRQLMYVLFHPRLEMAPTSNLFGYRRRWLTQDLQHVAGKVERVHHPARLRV